MIVVYDLEYTSWEGSLPRNWNGKNEYREVVQISCLRADNLESFRDIRIMNRFVKPVRNPKLSQYFCDLTGISQDKVEKEGVTYQNGFIDLKNVAINQIYCCWGNDLDVLAENHMLNGISQNAFEEFKSFDIREVFSSFGVSVDEYTSGTIYRAFDYENSELLPGKVHNAVSDVWSIYIGLRRLADKYGSDNVMRIIDV